MATPKDSVTDYYNLNHPHRWAEPDAFQHRLGTFRARGRGTRTNHPPVPSLGVLHVPHADIVSGGRDLTAERLAAYLADPGERRSASVHAFTDRDSFVISQPFDSEAWGAGNSNTNAASIQFEVGGLLDQGDAYWRSDDAALKYVQTAKAVVRGAWLAFGEDWEWSVPPLDVAELSLDGSTKRPGWTQHRLVPKWDRSMGRYHQPDARNQVKGQHSDVTENFPWNMFFEILAEEMIAFRKQN